MPLSPAPKKPKLNKPATILVPVRLQSELSHSSDEEVKNLFEDLLMMGQSGATRDQAESSAADAGWSASISRWAYAMVISHGTDVKFKPSKTAFQKLLINVPLFAVYIGGMLALGAATRGINGIGLYEQMAFFFIGLCCGAVLFGNLCEYRGVSRAWGGVAALPCFSIIALLALLCSPDPYDVSKRRRRE